MSESQRKEQARKTLRVRIAETDKRCIYCVTPVTAESMHIEHMPPTGMFKDQQRMQGMEFAACRPCNHGTRGADTVASFMARITPRPGVLDWRTAEARDLIASVRSTAPGVIEEFSANLRPSFMRTLGGIGLPMLRTDSGPRTQAYLDVFAAKVGMALYREHCGHPIPMSGGLHFCAFANAGLTLDLAKLIVSIMPMQQELRQGRMGSNPQFVYRYNTDEKTIVFALVQFHDGLYICVLAHNDREVYGRLQLPPFFRNALPGKLLEMMPPRLARTGYRRSVSGLLVPRRRQ